MIRSIFFDFPRALVVSREAEIHVETTSKKSPVLALSITRHTRLRALPNGERAVESWNAELALPSLTDAYADVSRTLPEQLVTGINALERGFVGHRLVPLVVARSERMLPWEAYLRPALSTTSITSELWLYRPVPAARRGRRASHRGSMLEVTLHHDASNRWSQTLWTASSYREVDQAAVVHAIGIPLRMASGIRLQNQEPCSCL